MLQWGDHVFGLFKIMSSLFVSQSGLFVKCVHAFGCMPSHAIVHVSVFLLLFCFILKALLRCVPPSSWCLLSFDLVCSLWGWSGSPTFRRFVGYQFRLLCMKLMSTLQEQTKLHWQKFSHMGYRQRGMQPHTVLSIPVCISPPCLHEKMRSKEQMERRQHWFLLYCFRKPVFLVKPDTELLISSLKFDAFLLLETWSS